MSGITFNADAGAFVLDGNAVELSGDIANQSPNTQTINLPLTLIGGSQTIDTAAGDVTIAGSIDQSGGSLGITKTGSGNPGPVRREHLQRRHHGPRRGSCRHQW